MNWHCAFLPVVAIGFLLSVPLAAQDVPPVIFAKEFSADMIITDANGMTVTNHMATSDGKSRSELKAHGMNIISIVRPDEQKVYSVLTDQKMVMVMPYDPEKYKSQMAATTGVGGKFDLVGPDTIEGVACTKYKETSQEGQTYYIWADANKLPVKMASADGTFTMFWKNYKPGPQDASLFEPPAGFQTMQMPGVQQIPQIPASGGDVPAQ